MQKNLKFMRLPIGGAGDLPYISLADGVRRDQTTNRYGTGNHGKDR